MTSFNTGKHIEEIDALRGVAVLLVVLYHAYPRLLPGGFIGVDVFFVISGFVISRTYLRPLINREITLRDFYVARLRRLTPAVLVICAVSALAVFSFALPDRTIAFAWSLLAQLVYVQNFVFWVEGDYFSGALTKPLLHTWSLAIEEQFYIFWAVLILGFRRFPKLVLWTVVVLVAGSLMLGFLLEGRSPKTVFFLLPFRIWEFAVGILVYLLVADRSMGPLSSGVYRFSTAASLAVILVAGAFFNEDDAFPGIQSFLACGATALTLLLIVGRPGPMGVLSAPSLRYVGKISYSLYLWHWPPLVFYYLNKGMPPAPAIASLLVLLSVLGAVLSFHFIEQPIRKKALLSSNATFFKVMGLSAILILVAGATMIASRGMLFRYPHEIQPFFSASQERSGFRCGQAFVLMNPSAEFCEITTSKTSGANAVLVLGDSHADVLKELLGSVADEVGVPLYLTVRNCDLGRYGALSFCSNGVLEKLIAQAQSRGVTDVLAISYWETDKFDAQTLSADIDRLRKAGIRVHIISAVPNDKSYDPRERAKKALDGLPLDYSGISLEKHQANSSVAMKIFKAAINKDDPMVELIDPSPYFCGSGQCTWHKDGIPFYLDSNHLTFTGGEVLRPLFAETIKSIRDSR
jgi:peptidoglycan/LPS O-acetylase OafA/YrhL